MHDPARLIVVVLASSACSRSAIAVDAADGPRLAIDPVACVAGPRCAACSGATTWDARRKGGTGDAMSAAASDAGLVAGGCFASYDIDRCNGAFIASWTRSGEPRFAKTFAADALDQATGGVAIDSHGNVVLAGRTGAPIDLGGGPRNGRLFLAKLDPSGHHLWSRAFGDRNDIFAGATAAVDAADGVVFAATFDWIIDVGLGKMEAKPGHAALVVARFDPLGTPLSGRLYDVEATAAVDAGGDVVLVGELSRAFGSGTLPPADAGYVHVARLDAAGDPRWVSTVTAGYPGSLVATVAPDAVVIAGTMSKERAPLRIGSRELIPRGWSPDAPFDYLFVAALDARGEVAWGAAHRASAQLTSISSDQHGNVLLAGYADTTLELDGHAVSGAFVAKLGSCGEVTWARGIRDGATALDRSWAGAVVASSDGTPFVAGVLPSTVQPPTWFRPGDGVFAAELAR